MSTSSETAEIDKLRKYFTFGLCLVVFTLSAGCSLITPSIFYPVTSVHGLVLDQQNNPVPGVKIEVSKQLPISLLLYDTPCLIWYIKSDSQGRWNVSARKVGVLHIEAMPPEGYVAAVRPDRVRATFIGPFESGACPTNDFILRIEKGKGKAEK